ncbi:MAG: hypothetical protein IIX01_04895, partial [Clostridia bacterium]|nr:hypothetical protein [Clostridia bacterium]
MILQFDRLQSVINGAVSCSNEEDGVLLHRFTSEQEELYKSYNEDFYKKTFASAGIQINLVTDAEKLDLKIATASGSSRKFFSCDLFVNGSFFDALDNFSDKDIPKYYAGMDGTLGEYRKTFDLGKGKKRLDLYLPWSVAVKIQTFDLQNATFYSPVKYGKKLLA